MRALVTGGAGFIGSNLVRELMRIGWSVHIVDDLSSGRISLIPEAEPDQVGPTVDIASFTDPYILDKIGLKNVDIIFHQAAIPRVSYSVAQPILTMQTNLLATAKLFRAAAERDVPVVWASSSSVYGGAEFLPTHESERGKFLPKSPYAMQKYHSEDYAALFGELYGLRSFGLRYFNVFGPGQYAGGPYSTAVAAWCHAIKNGEECRSDGDGTQSRDMCYVDNVVHANIQAAKVLLDGVPGPRWVDVTTSPWVIGSATTRSWSSCNSDSGHV